MSNMQCEECGGTENLFSTEDGILMCVDCSFEQMEDESMEIVMKEWDESRNRD